MVRNEGAPAAGTCRDWSLSLLPRKDHTMLRSAFFIALASVACVPTARAEATGNQLKAYCAAPMQTPTNAMCLGYISGALDAYRAVDHMRKTKLFCMPDGATGEQIVSMIKQYLDEHPEQLHLVASQLIYIVIAGTFPCTNQEK